MYILYLVRFYSEYLIAYEMYSLVMGVSSVLGPIGASVAFMYGFGNLMLDLRDNYVPVEYWKYFSYHRTWVHGYELRTFKGDDGIYYTEIPKNPDGTLNWDEAVTYGGSDTTYNSGS
ncbi:MAG: hypothetical protein HVN34_01680 [Methanobacteriaceae archaeon]|nr:hypothetical protein [Methanobacteriaceae archaeon]OPY30501.1 MAG: hypothetical protein A4E27_00040 [Methanobacterium sp. PtaU1.Bin242]